MNARRISPGVAVTDAPTSIISQWSLFESALHPVVVLDNDDRLTFANARAQA